MEWASLRLNLGDHALENKEREKVKLLRIIIE